MSAEPPVPSISLPCAACGVHFAWTHPDLPVADVVVRCPACTEKGDARSRKMLLCLLLVVLIFVAFIVASWALTPDDPPAPAVVQPPASTVPGDTPKEPVPRPSAPPAPAPSGGIVLADPEASYSVVEIAGVKFADVRLRVKYRFVRGKPEPGELYQFRAQFRPKGAIVMNYRGEELQAQGVVEMEQRWFNLLDSVEFEAFERTTPGAEDQSISNQVRCNFRAR